MRNRDAFVGWSLIVFSAALLVVLCAMMGAS
jgi:hypothetical protein